MNIEIGLLIVFILLIVYTLYQKNKKGLFQKRDIQP